MDGDDYESMGERMQGVVSKLASEVSERETRRRPFEQLWIEDLQQYHSQYDALTKERLKQATNRSKLFVNKTLEKTNAMASRLEDILFPTDDSNWSIAPTPVPNMIDGEAKDARARCDSMRDEMADQLEECGYQAACRDMIDQGCQIGTGVMKGPVTSERAKRFWRAVDEIGVDGTATSAFALEYGADPRPAFYWVDTWDHFPSVDARNPGDSEGFFTRHIWTKRQVKQFQHLPGVNRAALQRLISNGPRTLMPDHLRQIRAISSESMSTTDRIYVVWEYLGPLDPEDMALVAFAMGDERTAREMAEIDPLTETQASIWFCDNELLRFAIYPLDSGEPLFSRWCLQRDAGSYWGYGIPRLLRDPQAALNAAWRAMMDNAEISSGSQVMIDRNKIQPMDGDWEIRGRKLWEPLPGKQLTGTEFATFDIPSHQAELANIIELARQQIDEASTLPQMSQGETGKQPQGTAFGTAILVNQANILLKRPVKAFDDDVTVPNLRRLYDWNMQFNPRAEIKGDYAVTARGSSALLVKEMQSQTLMGILATFGVDPELGPVMRKVETLREVFRAHGLRPDDHVKTDDEIAETQAQPPAEDPMLAIEARKLDIMEAEIDAKVSIAQLDTAAREKVAQLNYEAAMTKMAESLNMSREQADAKMQAEREKIDQKDRSIATEAALRASERAPLNDTQIANE